MKPEEAIKTIESAKRFAYDDIYEEAFNMAVEALKNIKVLGKIPKEYLYDTETDKCLVYRNKYTGKEIHIIKPTDLFVLERPHGEWIEKPWGVVCSRCKSQALHSPNGNQLRSDFCPNCGSNNRKAGEKG